MIGRAHTKLGIHDFYNGRTSYILYETVPICDTHSSSRIYAKFVIKSHAMWMCACVSGLFRDNAHAADSSSSDYHTQTMKLCKCVKFVRLSHTNWICKCVKFVRLSHTNYKTM